MNVPPVICSVVSLFLRAASASASLWTRISRRPRVSALRSTGTIRPPSSATAMPMLISPWRTIASGSNEAFTPGWRRRASATALVTKSPSESLIFSAASCLFSRSRMATSSSTRMSTVTWISGAAVLASTIRWAIVLRIRVCGMRSAARCPSGGRWRGGLLGAGCEERLDVAADDPAAGPAAPDLPEVDLRRRGDLPGQRARLDPAADRRGLGHGHRWLGLRAGPPGRCCPGAMRLGPRRARSSLPSWSRVLSPRPPPSGSPSARPLPAVLLGDLLRVLALLRQHQHPLAQRDLVAVGVVEERDDPVVVRLHRHRRLVGLDLGQGVPFLDRVADLDQPLDDHPALHRRAELGHRHFDRHGDLSGQVVRDRS